MEKDIDKWKQFLTGFGITFDEIGDINDDDIILRMVSNWHKSVTGHHMIEAVFYNDGKFKELATWCTL